jgi:hypothetical protein
VIRREGFARGNYSTSYLEDVADRLPALAEAQR